MTELADLPLFSGPLYVGGRRRPGPNRFGFDPKGAGNLRRGRVPADRGHYPRPVKKAFEICSSWNTYAGRNDRAMGWLSDRFVRISRQERRELRAAGNTLALRQWMRRHHLRGELACNVLNLLQVAVLRADVETGACGYLDDEGRWHWILREGWARLSGLSLAQLDRAISALVANGLVVRPQEREELPERQFRTYWAKLVLTSRFWQVIGAAGERASHLAHLRNTREAERQRRMTPPQRGRELNIRRRHSDAWRSSSPLVAQLAEASAAEDRLASRRTEDPPPDPPDTGPPPK